MAGGSGALACDVQVCGLLTGEADGEVTRKSICMRATLLLRLVNVISSPSCLWSGQALDDNAMGAWLVSSSLLLFRTAGQMLGHALDIQVLLVCRKGNRYLSPLYILLDHRYVIYFPPGLHLYMMSERACGYWSHRLKSRGCCHSPVMP